MTNQTKNLIKKSLKAGIKGTKQIIHSNKYTRSVAQKTKRLLIEEPENVEVYDYLRFHPSIKDYKYQTDNEKKLKIRPLISIVVPTYNTDEAFLRECIESVIIQSYTNWELCIADDASTDKITLNVLKEYEKKDSRIKVIYREENGHISIASNSAIDISEGEFIALLDHDDVLWPTALFEIVEVINKNPKIDFIYTDEDKIDSDGKIHSYPFFKPDWSPEFLESCNYITHFSCIRTDLIKKVGGFRKGYEGAQDWDLFVRVTEKTDKIVHIPKILYSWRVHEASTAKSTDAKPYVYTAQRKLLEDHVGRGQDNGDVKTGLIKQHSSITYKVKDNPKISIFVTGSNQKEINKSKENILRVNKYKNYEIFENINGLSNEMQEAINKSRGQYLVFIDSSPILKSRGWVEKLLGDAQRNGVGVVGVRVIDKTGYYYEQAGVGVGVDGLCDDLLRGISLNDIHYMKGLYGLSRRNVSAAHGVIMISKEAFLSAGGLLSTFHDNRLNYIDLCLRVLDKGYRNVYTPYVDAMYVQKNNRSIEQTISHKDKMAFKKRWNKYIKHDPYLNPNFSKVGGGLNVK